MTPWIPHTGTSRKKEGVYAMKHAGQLGYNAPLFGCALCFAVALGLTCVEKRVSNLA